MRRFSTAAFLHGQQRNPPVVVAIRTILLFGKDLGGRIFPLPGGSSRFSHVDKHLVKASEEFGVVDFQ